MTAKKETVSVVIPTFNRKVSLLRTLQSLVEQTFLPYEIIIVEAGEDKLNPEDISRFQNICILSSTPSVCAQRNIGIKKATGDYILLLDDDIVLDQHYIQFILSFLNTQPESIACSGLVMEKNIQAEWQYTFTKVSVLKLFWSYIFQLGIWADLDSIHSSSFLSKWLKGYYQRKGNTLSKAGWPLLIDFRQPYFRTQLYGLGASIFKKTWLEKNLYDENLDQYGIGDNYGVSIRLPEKQGVFVLHSTKAYHYKESSNRLLSSDSYLKRVTALHYFILKEKKSSTKWLAWSLTGNLITSIFNGQLTFVKINLLLITRILLNKNPLIQNQNER